MAQYRQSGFDRVGGRSYDHQNHYGNGGTAAGADHVAIGVRASQHSHKQPRSRRLAHKGAAACKISIGSVVVVLCLVLALTVFAYTCVSRDKEINADNTIQDDDFKNDFLTNVSRINMSKVKFGHGSVNHGRDSRYWDGDDRRRDEDYNEEVVDKSNKDEPLKSDPEVKEKASRKSHNGKIQGTDHHGLYNEAGRNELKMYEEKYEASLKNVGQTGEKSVAGDQVSDDGNLDMENEEIDIDDEYDDGIDSHDARMEEDENIRHDEADNDLQESQSADDRNSLLDVRKTRSMIEDGGGSSEESSQDNTVSLQSLGNTDAKPRNVHVGSGQTATKSSHSTSKRKRKHRSASCELKFLNSTAQLVEPLENRKFSRFSLRYAESEVKPDGLEHWEPRFAGHQTLQEREDSFLARDQRINCGFIKGPPGFPSTGFDLAEGDSSYISKCHIAVISCIFGNSDRLRSPAVKMVSRLSRKNVCFVMFTDETTLQTLSSEGHMPDRMGFIGLWKMVVVKNLPYDDMRRVGKIPKLLPHRLFPSARYSIWLDSKLRLQRDPLLILEYFLWRKGYEFAISNHYDRHCVWEEVARNKKLNKYNHTFIDQQFAFYQADGLKRFNASDPHKLLPSNVPEGSFIIRAHTPMSNLFSCLWFNEVDRFTPRDQLSFAYTYQKLKKKNPSKPFYLHMFKDCERRAIAKLFRHRSPDKLVISQDATE